MNRCWVLIVTRGLRLWLPPEVYLQRDLALREGERWRATFRIPARQMRYTDTARVLTLIETLFPESWRACPLWVGIAWNVRSYPTLKAELMAADEDEAAEWLRQRAPKRIHIKGPGNVEFERRGALCGVGIARAKRVLGF